MDSLYHDFQTDRCTWEVYVRERLFQWADSGLVDRLFDRHVASWCFFLRYGMPLDP